MIFNTETKEKTAQVAKKYGLDFVALFGSQATGKTHSTSDIDIAVITHAKLNRAPLEMELCDILKRADIQIVNLADASPTLMNSVVHDSSLIYEKTTGDFLRWKIYAMKIWMDTAWLRQLRRRQLTEWATRVS